MSNATGVRVARNFGALLLAQTVTWSLTLVLTVLLARYLGAENVGKLYLATSLWMVVTIVAAFGTDLYLTKAVSRDRSAAASLFAPALAARAVLGLLSFLPVAAYVYVARYPSDTVTVIFLIGIGQFLMQLGAVPRAILQGLERMEYVSLGDILSKLFITAITVGALLAGYGVYVAAAATVGGGIVYVVTLTITLAWLEPMRTRTSAAAARAILRAGLPYVLPTVLLASYMQIDIVILSLLTDETTVGWYGAALQLTGSFIFVAVLLVTAMFPVLARTHTEDQGRLVEITRRSSYLLFLISLPIGLGIAVVARPLVLLLFGAEFEGCAPVLALMGLMLLLTYQNTLLGRVLLSIDRQRHMTVIVAGAVVATVLLDIVLVPWSARALGNGGIGGAIAFIMTELWILIACVYALPAAYRRREGSLRFVRAALAGTIMVIAVWPVRESPILIPVAVGAVTFGVLVPVLHLLPEEDRRLLRAIVDAARGGLSQWATPRAR